MQKVLIFSILLIAGMAGSQFLGGAGGAAHALHTVVQVGTMLLLGFIMIHVGLEFEIDRSRLGTYAADFGIAGSAAALPWLLCAAWFRFAIAPPETGAGLSAWTQSLIAGCFAAPTSAGVLFSMLAAAGLSSTWLFRKARVLAIFDDLQTVLLVIPLKIAVLGVRWQLGVVAALMGSFLWAGWRWMRRLAAPATWPWVLAYAAVITVVCEGVHHASKVIDEAVPIHIEVLLPAFALGCMLAHGPHTDGHHDAAQDDVEQRVSTIVSGVFMALVGLSMPEIDMEGSGLTAASLAFHTLAVTVLSNLGKMAPLFFYGEEAGVRERLALCVGMWPRGEVGAGILILSIGYGIGGAVMTVATFSLALNLVLTGVFILAVKRLLAVPQAAAR